MSRYRYNVLDFLSQVGGLYGITAIVIGSLANFLSGDTFNEFLISKLFSFKVDAEGHERHFRGNE